MSKRRRSTFDEVYPDQLAAQVSREQAEAILRFDHHRVKVGGRWGVLLTYYLMPLEEAAEPLMVRVVFHYAEAHPLAPPEVQAVIEELKFGGIPS
jgi:hypothetical protein